MGRKTVHQVKLRDIDLIVYDFDGVMTDNRVFLSEMGEESVRVNRSDGLAVSLLKAKGVPQVILSTETNPVVTQRGKKLGIPVMDSCRDKAKALAELCRSKGYRPERVIYVGNDINDLAAMKWVGHPVAPADAAAEAREIACLVTKARGGEGVVRELFGHLK